MRTNHPSKVDRPSRRPVSQRRDAMTRAARATVREWVSTLERRTLFAADPALVADINLDTANSTPAGYVPVTAADGKTYVFFRANDGEHGIEVWRTDGTPTGASMVMDINPGSGSSGTSSQSSGQGVGRDMTAMGGAVYFGATDGTNAAPIWRADGTSVTRLTTIPLSTPAQARNFTAVGNAVYFTVNNQLWKTDGTEAGTSLVRTVGTNTFSGALANFTNFNGTLAFAANDGQTGTELWTSDGTETGTARVADIFPGTSSSSPTGLTVVGDTLYFVASDGVNGTEVWKTDGTATGTSRVTDINPGSGSSSPGLLTAFGGRLYFRSLSPSTSLWSTDGTAGGTQLVRTFTSINAMAAAGGSLYVTANDGTTGSEVWRSDGTSTGTALLLDIEPGTTSSSPASYTDVGGKVFFTTTTQAKGTRLHVTDGTEAGTLVVSPGGTSPIGEGRSIGSLVAVGSTLYFSATDAEAGTEPWTSDGTLAGTTRLHDINQVTLSSSPNGAVNFNGRLYFVANDGAHGQAVWSTDGVTTTLLKATQPPDAATNFGVSGLTVVGDRLLFSANDGVNGQELWASDGSTDGTVLLKDINPGANSSNPTSMANVGGVAYFAANDGTNGIELWRSDGTPGGTYLVKDLNPGSGFSGPFGFTPVANNRFVFAATDAGGLELWVSDGTAGGTSLLKDIFAGGSSSSPSGIISVNGVAYFSANNGTNGAELWRSDGTATGTALVRDIFPGASSSSISSLTNLNGVLYFSANNGVTGSELWRSDGTSAGTAIVADIFPGISGSGPSALTVVGPALFFAANNGTNGTELWRSDGTSGGTSMVADILPGSVGSGPAGLRSTGTQLLFRASTTAAGSELWRSDSTVAGTVQVADVFPGTFGSQPTILGQLGDRVFFSADDGTHGTELWSFVPPAPAAPVADPGGPYFGSEGTPVNLSSGGSTGAIFAYAWDLDYDGNPANFSADVTGAAPPVVFPDGPAVRTIALRVTGPGGTDLRTTTVTVDNLAPVVNAGGPRTAAEGAPVTLNGSASDPGNDALTLSWLVTGPGGFSLAGSGNAVTFTPPDDGAYTAVLTATDADGATSTDSAAVSVVNVAPVLTLTPGPAVIDEGSTYTLGLAASDPGADTISTWTIDWGDGTAPQTFAGSVTSATHLYADGPATRAITVSATDEDGTFTAAPPAQPPTNVGALDTTSFNPPAGYVLVGSGPAATSTAVMPDGRIVLGGRSGGGLSVHRLTPSGATDTTFGGGDGHVPLPGNNSDGNIALQPDGKILAVSTFTNRDIVVYRLNVDGSVDSTFGNNGTVYVDFDPLSTTHDPYNIDQGVAAVALADGRILIAGTSFIDQAWRACIARLNPDGSLDTTFGNGGRVLAHADPTRRDTMLYAFAVAPDGDLLAAGYAGNAGNTGDRRFAVLRFNPDGSPDTTFGVNGAFSKPQGGFTGDELRDVVGLPDGRVIAVGFSQAGGTVIRLTANGTLDTTFGSGTGLVVPRGGWYYDAVAVDSRGGILAGGTGFQVDRLLESGATDTSYRGSSINVPLSNRFIYDLAVAPDGRVIAAGTGSSAFVAARLVGDPTLTVTVRNVAPTADAGPDRSINEGDTLTLNATSFDPGVNDAVTYTWVISANNQQLATRTGPTLTYTFDLSTTYQVRLTARDKDGATGVDDVFVTAANVAPTATVSAPTSVAEGSPATISFNNVFDPSASDTANLNFSYDFDNDGTFEVTNATPAYAIPAELLDDGNRTRTIRARVADPDGAGVTFTLDIAVTNVTPVAGIGGAPADPVVEGYTTTLVAAASDPSAADTAAGFTFTWTVTRPDGTVITTGTGPTFPFAAPDDGSYFVRLDATDKDGATGTTNQAISVLNAAPVVTAVQKVGAYGVRGQQLEFTAAFTDAGALDTHTVTWNFGDGSPPVTLPATDPAALRQWHAFAAEGFRNVTVTVVDNATDRGSRAAGVNVAVVQAQPDPATPGATAVVIGGTAWNDVINFTSAKKTDALQVFVNKALVGTFTNAVSRVIVFGQTGNDTIDATGVGNRTTLLYGDAGADTLTGGARADVLAGGDGDDLLNGNDGRDVLIGSAGADRLNGGDDEDLLLAAGTTHDRDADSAALLAVLADWNRSVSYATRVSSLSAGLLGTANRITDSSVDTLTGGKQSDWFLGRVSGATADIFNDRAGSETQTNV